MADYLPKFKPGGTVTATASADVTGGQLLEISGNYQVRPAGAASTKVFGVAGQDTANGSSVTVHRGGVQRLVASGAIAAGDSVQAAAGGKVATGDTAPIGVAIKGGADGESVDVAMN